MIINPAVQNAKEELGPIILGFIGVAFHQAKHRFLHNIHRVIGIAHGNTRNTKSFAFYLL
jgi:hypothetical protein